MSIPTHIPSLPKGTSDAITLVTDPYHDYNLRATGYPDGNALISVVQRFAGRYDLACPFALTAGMSWDFHVFTTPFHSVTTTYAGTADVNMSVLSTGPSPISQPIGPVNVLYRLYDTVGSVVNTLLVALPAVDIATDQQRRTVSLGFELHNTTPELYKSGSLSVYRQPVQSSLMMPALAASSTMLWPSHLICQVPYTIADVQLIPNSRVWEAKDGAYSVCLPHPSNTFSTPASANLVLRAGVLTNSVLLNRYQLIGSSHSTYSPLACSGVMSSRFTTADTTFTLDFRQIVESVPTSNNPTLMSFATTAPMADLAFMKIYKRMFNNIAPAVPVHFNAAGDWYRGILAVVKEVLPHIAAVLPGAAKPIALAATPVINSLIDKALQKKINVTQRMVTPTTVKHALLPKKSKKKRK